MSERREFAPGLYGPLSDEEAAELEEVDDIEIAPREERSTIISVRLNHRELTVFSEAARKTGLPLSTYIKSAAWQWTNLEAERPRYVVRDADDH